MASDTPVPGGAPSPFGGSCAVPRALLGLLLLALTVTVSGCHLMKPPWTPRTATGASPAGDTATADSAAVDTTGTPGERSDRGGRARPAATDTALPEGYPSTGELLEKGPTYTDYAIGPELLPGEWLSDLLGATLAPVVDRNDGISTDTHALYWVLVDREGEVRDAVLHTSSRSDAFDKAARAVAERLRYRPAVTDGRAVPVWVLARVSLLMR